MNIAPKEAKDKAPVHFNPSAVSKSGTGSGLKGHVAVAGSGFGAHVAVVGSGFGAHAAVKTLSKSVFFDNTTKEFVPVEAIKKSIIGMFDESKKSSLDGLLRKINEGSILKYDSVEDLFKKINQKGYLFIGSVNAKENRRLNRIIGQMESKLDKLNVYNTQNFVDFSPQVGEILTSVKNLVDFEKIGTGKIILEQSAKLLEDVKGFMEAKNDSRFLWHLFDLLSHLGPLSFTYFDEVNKIKGKVPEKEYKLVEAKQKEIVRHLRDIRQMMAKNSDGVSVVAHRGNGPTNRTMGRLVGPKDNRRLFRMAENSPESFEQALKFVANSEDETPKLDGIECDVFISKDGVPMLSHEGNVFEQLNENQKYEQFGMHGLNESSHVHQLNSDQLKAIKRNQYEGSGFMSLQDLLTMVMPAAKEYFEVTGRAFRVEVEMKGVKEQGDLLKKQVAKVISQFSKNADSPIEIILFNNDLKDVKDFSNFRDRKSAMGGIYTGTGSKERPRADDKNSFVDEIRYQFNDEFGNLPNDKIGDTDLQIANNYLENFIVTLVFGQEFSPEPSNTEPSHTLMDNRSGEYRELSDSKIKELANRDLQIQKALEKYVTNKANYEKVKKLHVLTDYPQKAAWMKYQIQKALEASVEKALKTTK